MLEQPGRIPTACQLRRSYVLCEFLRLHICTFVGRRQLGSETEAPSPLLAWLACIFIFLGGCAIRRSSSMINKYEYQPCLSLPFVVKHTLSLFIAVLHPTQVSYSEARRS